jgi:nucleoside-diphosphate-sugar epimerase
LNVLITGADGFVGRALVARVLADGAALNAPLDQLILVDRQFGLPHEDKRLKPIVGSFGDVAVLRDALADGLADGVDVAFHLASIPGGAAERDYELGQRVNVHDTFALFEALRKQAAPPTLPTVVFASSIAVYGSPMPARVDATTPATPTLSYGAQKLMGEIALQDLSRRGDLDGRALRLPGIVARPLQPSGLISAFMSDIIRRLAAGQPFTCPVSPNAVAWWMSATCCVDNLLHAARLPASQLNGQRTWQLPALRFTMGELVQTLATLFGADRLELVRYEPNEQIEASFGRYPPLDASLSEAVGFHHDGDIESLVRNALADSVVENIGLRQASPSD